MWFGVCRELQARRKSYGWIRASRLISASMPALCAARFSQSELWDRPDVTRMTLFGRMDSPSLMGPSMDRIDQ